MRSAIGSQLHQEDPPQYTKKHFSWIRSRWFGYPVCLFLVGALMLIKVLDQYIPRGPLLIGSPFVLLSILITFVWGRGPALFSAGLGLIGILMIASPHVLTINILEDIVLVGPFLLLQLIVITMVVNLVRSHERLLAAHQALEASNQRLLQSHSQLKQANEQKDYVITRASHELRSPLTTILGRAQLLASRLEKTGETPENWAALRKYIEVIEARALYLRTLVERLFDLNVVQSGEAPLQLGPCDLERLCREMIEDQQVLSGRSIELEPLTYPLVLQADYQRLSQVIINLLTNAIQYSPENSRIRVRMYSEDNQIVVQVQNACPALPPEQVARFFEPFYRAPSVQYSPIQGWGLGLAISKEIVERHGGQIWAESSTDNRITIVMRLPLQRHAE